MSSVRQRISSVPHAQQADHAVQADHAKHADHSRQAEKAYFADQAHSAQSAHQARQADKSGNARAFGGVELVQFTERQQRWDPIYMGGGAQSVTIGFKRGLWKVVYSWGSGQYLVNDLYLAGASGRINSGSIRYHKGVLKVGCDEKSLSMKNCAYIIAVYHLRHS